MKSILNNLISHEEAEQLSLTNMEEEVHEHQKYKKKKLMEEMTSKPSYNNYLTMQQIVFETNYEAGRMLKIMHEMRKKHEEVIKKLKRNIKELPKDIHPYV